MDLAAEWKRDSFLGSAAGRSDHSASTEPGLEAPLSPGPELRPPPAGGRSQGEAQAPWARPSSPAPQGLAARCP